MNTYKKENNEYQTYKVVALHKGYDVPYGEEQGNDMAHAKKDQGAFA